MRSVSNMGGGGQSKVGGKGRGCGYSKQHCTKNADARKNI